MKSLRENEDLQSLGELIPDIQADINKLLTERIEACDDIAASEQEKLLEKKVLDGDEDDEDEGLS